MHTLLDHSSFLVGGNKKCDLHYVNEWWITLSMFLGMST